MSTDRDTTRIVRSWLKSDEHEDAGPVLESVLELIDTTPQRRATSWPERRLSTMNSTVKFGLAAAVVAVAALIGINYLGASSVGGPGTDISTPTPTPTPEPTPSPTPMPEGLLEAGTTVSFIEVPDFTVTLTTPASGWVHAGPEPIMTKDDTAEPPDGAGLIAWTGELFVYDDPCRWMDARPSTPVSTVDDLVAAISAQPMRDASAATDITVDGYPGKAIELTVPADLDFADCDRVEFRSWVQEPGDAARYHQGPGQQDLVWIVDVDGTPLVIDAATFEGTPATVRAELEAILDSIQIEPN